MINREEALSILHKYLQDDKLRKHSYAVEAIMKKTAQYLKEDTQLWSIVGLLHDIDYEYTQNNPNEHGNVSADLLNDLLPSMAINAIKGHNYIHTGYLPTTYLDKALIASDAVSGLIIATALVMPNKTLAEIKQSTLKKKMNDSSFAKSVDRKRIKLCQDLGIDLDAFLKMSLTAMNEIHTKLDL
jgi:putative nucleotidyltransferase with HDIG domain